MKKILILGGTLICMCGVSCAASQPSSSLNPSFVVIHSSSSIPMPTPLSKINFIGLAAEEDLAIRTVDKSLKNGEKQQILGEKIPELNELIKNNEVKIIDEPNDYYVEVYPSDLTKPSGEIYFKVDKKTLRIHDVMVGQNISSPQL